MKLRFRQNSLRLRVNRREAEDLSLGTVLTESIDFPGGNRFAYLLQPAAMDSPRVEFTAGTVRVSIPRNDVQKWASGDDIGMYFDLPANGTMLKVAIEKDLECIDGPREERDPDAYPRSGKNC